MEKSGKLGVQRKKGALRTRWGCRRSGWEEGAQQTEGQEVSLSSDPQRQSHASAEAGL